MGGSILLSVGLNPRDPVLVVSRYVSVSRLPRIPTQTTALVVVELSCAMRRGEISVFTLNSLVGNDLCAASCIVFTCPADYLFQLRNKSRVRVVLSYLRYRDDSP